MLRIFALVLTILLSKAALAQSSGPASTAPAGFDRKAELNTVFEELRQAENASQARYATESMWKIYLRAPDERTAEDMNKALRAKGGYNFEKALALLDAIAERHPFYAEARNQRATIYFLQEDFDRSLRECEAVLAIAPRHLGCLSGMAIILIRHKKDYEAGRTVLDKALSLHPFLAEKSLLQELPQ